MPRSKRTTTTATNAQRTCMYNSSIAIPARDVRPMLVTCVRLRCRKSATGPLAYGLDEIERYERDYRDGDLIEEVRILRTRVCGSLRATATSVAGVSWSLPRQDPVVAMDLAPAHRLERERASASSTARGSAQSSARCGEDDDRMLAMNSLLQMNSSRAVPLLKRVLENRNQCEDMRKQAVFILSQQPSSEVVDLLLEAAKNDPSHEVRKQAVFGLSQARDPRVVDVLQSILLESRDREIQGQALFALSQVSGPRSQEILRAYIERKDVPTEDRAQAIVWLGQGGRRRNRRVPARSLRPRH